VIRVLIVDDHPVVRAGLTALLASEPGFEVVGDVATGEESIASCESGDVDLVLMDLQLGDGMQGAAATRVLRGLSPAPKVLILTNYDTDADILSAVEAGASGYLLKDAPPSELISAAQAAASGASALSPTIAQRLGSRRNAVGSALSAREIEVIGLVAAGKSNSEIGRALFLSEATVKSHLSHIFTKLGVSSRTRAVAAAREAGTIR